MQEKVQPPVKVSPALTPTSTPTQVGVQQQPFSQKPEPKLVQPFAPAPSSASNAAPEPPPDLRTQLERAERFGHNFGRVKVFASQPAVIQRKVIVGQPGDQYEQEADRVAQQVMRMPAPVQTHPIQSLDKAKHINRKPLHPLISSAVQRHDKSIPPPKPAQPLLKAKIQRREEEFVKWVPPQSLLKDSAESVELQHTESQTIQRKCAACEEEEESLQRKFLATSITPLVLKKAASEEKETLQMQTLASRQVSTDSNIATSNDLETQLNRTKGGGSPLSAEVRSYMEPRFGFDFSKVRIHNDSTAVQLNRQLGAQAFTHGQDIYFNAGKSAGISELTAHELTHVVQQTGTQDSSKFMLQRRRDKSQKVFVFKIDVTEAVEANEFLAITLAQIFRISLSDAQTLIKEQNWYWENYQEITAEDIQNGYKEVGINEAAYYRMMGQVKGEDEERGEDGRRIGYSERQKSLKNLSEEQISWLNKKTNEGFWERTGYKPGQKLDPKKSKADRDMAELWLDIRDELLAEIERGSLGTAVEEAEHLDSEPVESVNADWSVLENAEIAARYLQVLEHYAGRNISAEDRVKAGNGLSKEEVIEIIASKPLLRFLTDFYTQGYREFQAAGGEELAHFFKLEETIIEQLVRGNPTVTHNQLRIGYGIPEANVLGIAHRLSGILYYDANGFPLPGLGGAGMRDKGYIGAEQSEKFGINIANIEDPALKLLLNTLRQSISDPTRMAVAAAEIYFENVERVNGEVQKGLSEEIWKKFEESLPFFIGFLAGHGLSALLMRSPHPAIIAVGLALKGLLTAANYVMSIDFAGEALQRLLDAAYHLSRVEQNKQGNLTELSNEHLQAAAAPIRQMVADIALSAGTLALGQLLRGIRQRKHSATIECTECHIKTSALPKHSDSLRQKFSTEIEKVPELKNRLAEIDQISNANDAAKALKQIEHKLASLAKGEGTILRETRRNNGEIIIESVVGKSPRKRLGYEKELPPAVEVNLKGWERAHSQGKITGAESREGILYAPRSVNQEYQRLGIEGFIKDFNARKADDVTLYLTTITEAHPGTLRLNTITYRLEASRPGGRRTILFEGGIKIDNKTKDPKIDHFKEPEFGGTERWEEFLKTLPKRK